MAKAAPALTAFNAGELSPRLEGRVDLAKYANGCRRLENFLPMVQGGLIKRSGTRFVSATMDSADITRLIPFEFGTTQAYILEFGNYYCRVLKDSGHVLDPAVAVNAVAASTPIRITTAAAHGYATGDKIFVSGTAAAGINSSYFHITVITGTTFDLLGTSSIGAFGAGGTVAHAVQFATPYTIPQLAAIQYAQSADVLYLVHPEHAPHKLSRTSHTSWTLAKIAFDAPPFAQENLDKDEYMVASAATGSVSLYSTGGRFTAAHVGSYVKLAETLEGTYPEWQGGIDSNLSSGTPIYGYRIGGVQLGAGGENMYLHYSGRLYRVVGTRGNVLGGAAPLHDVGIQCDGNWDLEYINSGYGWAQITDRTDAYLATATVVREFGRTAFSTARAITAIGNTTPITITSNAHGYDNGDTVFIRGTLLAGINNQTFIVMNCLANTFQLTGTVAAGAFGAGGTAIRVKSAILNLGGNTRRVNAIRWAFGAFSTERGYPSSVAFFEDRLWWAGTSSDPQGLWASRTGRYEDHLYTDEDDGALFLLLNTQQVNAIEWLSAGKRMAIGTLGGEFVLEGATEGPVTAGNVKAPQHSYYGSRGGVAPLRVESVTLFVQRSGKKLIEYGFEFDSNNYQGQDLTVLAHHVTLPKITELAWQQEPDRLVWAVLEDGQLVAMTYDRAQEVIGWHRHELGGTAVFVESIAVIPHPDGDADQLWLIVRRTVNGTTRRYIEILERTWEIGTAISDAFFVDAGSTYSAAPATTITGLWHLVGESVIALGDGLYLGAFTVSATGTITLPVARSKVHVGLAYEANLETMRLEAGAQNGTAQGKTKKIVDVVLRLEDTGSGIQYGYKLDLYPITQGTLFSGDTKRLAWPKAAGSGGGYEQDARLKIRHAVPLPCTLIAMFPTVDVED